MRYKHTITILQNVHESCVSRTNGDTVTPMTDTQHVVEEDFGRQVKAARTKAGWSQARLAEVLGLDASGVSRLEAGRKRLALAEAVRIASALGVSLDRLLAPVSPAAELDRALTAADDAVVLARRQMVVAVDALASVVAVAVAAPDEVVNAAFGDREVGDALTVRVSEVASAAGSATVDEDLAATVNMWATAMGDGIAASPQRG